MVRRAAPGILAALAALTATAGLAVALTGGGASAAGPAPAPPASSLTWHAPVRADGTGLGDVMAVSCPAASYCAAFDNAGYQATWDGTRWSAPVKIVPDTSDYGLLGAACATPAFCVAVGTAIWVESAGRVTRFHPGIGGPVWVSVSCASPAFCVAGDSAGEVTMYNGHSWSSPAAVDEDTVSGISCVSATFCLALDFDGSVLRWNGTAWSTADPDLVPFGDAAGISCASATFCVAFDIDGEAYTFNGSAWSGPGAIGLGQTPVDVSCTSRTFCVAVAATGDAAQYDGSAWSRWSRPVLTSPDTVFVACSPGSGDCAAIGETGYAALLRSGTWTAQAGVDAPAELDAIACPTTAFCVATGVLGDLVTYRGAAGGLAGTWSAPVRLLPGGALGSVSCPTARYCLLAGATGSGALRMWQYNGVRWSPAAVPAAGSGAGSSAGTVSCVSAAFCVWASAAGDISRYNGKTWTKPADVDKDRQWMDVSCATASFCVAGDMAGKVATYNGKTWSGLRSIGISDGVAPDAVFWLSCTSPRFCAAALGLGAATFNGSTWTDAPASDNPQLTAVSCVPGGFCAGLGSTSSGSPAAFTFNGRQWSGPVAVFTTWSLELPVAISCATAKFCMGTDAYGLVTAGTAG